MNCKRCGAKLQRDVLICPECGARQRREAGWVRCASCRRRTPADLAVCPHCGRNLRPAGPLWGAWLVGLAAVMLFGWWGFHRLPVQETWQRVLRLPGRMVALAQVPDAQPSAATATPTGVQPTRAFTRLAPILTPLPPTSTMTVTAAISGTATVTATVTVTATQATPAAQPTEPAPTATPQPTATPDPNRYYTVKAGDTLLGIADEVGVAWEQIAQANGISDVTSLQVGQRLKIPTASGGAAQPAQPAQPAPTATPKPQPKTYTVRSGDTLMSIAGQFGISWDQLAAANNLTSRSVLHIGQELTIPSP